jgi:hypothetical protein
MDLQHINVKVFARDGDRLRTGDYTGVFNRWIQERALAEMLVDVADYGHVHQGPGLVLIGHEANYSLDQQGGRLGLLYNRKAPVEGPPEARLAQALRSALIAAHKLEREEGLRFSGNDAEIMVNDRLLAPNTPETLAALKPALEAVFNRLYAGQAYTLAHTSTDPRQRFSVTVSTAASFDVATLLSHLEAEAVRAG